MYITWKILKYKIFRLYIVYCTSSEIKYFTCSDYRKETFVHYCLGDDLGATFLSFNDLLKESDFIIVATPLNSETLNMFDDDAFTRMKKTAVLVNVGRGPVVDTNALVGALEKNTIFAAGLDVVNPEPLPSDHVLLTLPNASEFVDLHFKSTECIIKESAIDFFNNQAHAYTIFDYSFIWFKTLRKSSSEQRSE